MEIKRLPAHDRPRERLRLVGEQALSDAELLAVVLGGDLECAARLVERFVGASGVARARVDELCTVAGVGPARATQLVAAVELGRRGASVFRRGDPITSSDQAHELLRDMASLEDEELHVLFVDARHRVLTREVPARGTLNRVHVIPRDILRRGVRVGAHAMIIAHNHPSGDKDPSPDDLALTRRVFDAGEVVGLSLLDHLVVARSGFFAFAPTIARWRGEKPGSGSLQ